MLNVLSSSNLFFCLSDEFKVSRCKRAVNNDVSKDSPIFKLGESAYLLLDRKLIHCVVSCLSQP